MAAGTYDLIPQFALTDVSPKEDVIPSMCGNLNFESGRHGES